MTDETYQKATKRLGREVRKDTRDIIGAHVSNGLALQRLMAEASGVILTADAEVILLEKAQRLQRAQSEFAAEFSRRMGRKL